MFKRELSIDWTDLNVLGYVRHQAFYKYIQKLRREVLVAAHLCKLDDSETIGTMLVHMECNFKKPLHFPGTITIRARIIEVGRTSFKTRYTISDESGEIAAEAVEIQVYYDFAIPGKAVISPEQRAAMLGCGEA